MRRYDRARAGALWGQVWAALTGRPHSLVPLSAVEAGGRVRSHRWAGAQTVSIRDIQGSEGRCQDFDASFRPRQEHTRNRWVSIATAWEEGIALPPVELIQVGDRYFVRDGHHRISVARTMGQEHVDAEVVVWEVKGPLPWARGPRLGPQRPTVCELAHQPRLAYHGVP